MFFNKVTRYSQRLTLEKKDYQPVIYEQTIFWYNFSLIMVKNLHRLR